MSHSTRLLQPADQLALARLCDDQPVRSLLVRGRLANQPGVRLAGVFDDSQLLAVSTTDSVLYASSLDAALATELVAGLRDAELAIGSIAADIATTGHLQEALSVQWGMSPRLVRESQPFLSLSSAVTVSGAELATRVTVDQLGAYTAAGAKMYAEEVNTAAPTRSLRRRFEQSIAQGRSFAWAEAGRVLFKCDIAFVVDEVCHLQGVWLDPRWRGQGLAQGLLADVLRAVQAEVAPVVTLYVNDFNAPARALYSSLGFHEVDRFATVFY